MKKIYLLWVLVWISTFSQAQFTEDFDTTSPGSLPDGWTAIDESGDTYWNVGTPTGSAYTGTQAAIIAHFDDAGNNKDYLVSPQIVVGANNKYISFYAKSLDPVFLAKFKVVLSTGANSSGAAFSVNLSSEITAPNAWTKYEYDLSAYVGQNVYVSVVSTTPTGGGAFAVDHFVNNSGPTCPKPTAITHSNNTAPTLSLDWTPGGSETEWLVSYSDVSTFVPGSTGSSITNITTTSHPLVITGLTANKTYYFYVRANCSGTDQSQWAGPYTVTSVPNWCGTVFYDSGGVSGNYANNENITTVIAPANPGQAVTVTFTSFNTESGYDYLKVYNGPNATYPALHTGNGFSGTTLPGSFTATTESGALTFVFTSDFSGTRSGWAANVTCAALPTCLTPTGVTSSAIAANSATIAWTPGQANQTQWQIEYGPANFAHGTGTTQIVSGTPSKVITGLNPQTTYDVYVKAICSETDSSLYSMKYTFTTACTSSPIPWTENFDSLTTIGTTNFPACWKKENGDWRTANTASTTYVAPRSAPNYLRNTYSATNEFMWTPGFDLTAGVTYEVSYYYSTDGHAGWTNIGLYSNTSQTSAGAILMGSLVSNPTNTAYTKLKRYFTPATTGTYFFAVRLNATSAPWYIGFDDFEVKLAPSCPEPETITVNNTTTTTANLSWTQPGGNGTSWTIEYGPVGFTPGTGTVVTSSTNSVTIQGLTHSTQYDVYVTATCSAETSIISDKATFRTKVPNDECSTAIPLTPSTNAYCSNETTGSTYGANPSAGSACIGNADDDVWYSFVATSTQHTIYIYSNVDMAHAVYTGSCGNLTLVKCSDPNTSNLTGLTVGQTYYIRVYTFATSVNDDFTICITTTPQVPTNDACSNAINVPSLPYTNYQDATAATNNSGFITACATGMNDGVWYTFTGNGSAVNIKVDPVAWDAAIGVYTGSCGNFTCVGKASNAGTGGEESYTFTTSIGTVYYVNVGFYSYLNNGAEGPMTISITPTSLGVDDLQTNIKGLNIYPNPTKDYINIKSDKQVKSASVFNLNGALIKSVGNSPDNKIDVQELKTGVYVIKVIFDDNSSISEKVIKE